MLPSCHYSQPCRMAGCALPRSFTMISSATHCTKHQAKSSRRAVLMNIETRGGMICCFHGCVSDAFPLARRILVMQPDGSAAQSFDDLVSAEAPVRLRLGVESATPSPLRSSHECTATDLRLSAQVCACAAVASAEMRSRRLLLGTCPTYYCVRVGVSSPVLRPQRYGAVLPSVCIRLGTATEMSYACDAHGIATETSYACDVHGTCPGKCPVWG